MQRNLNTTKRPTGTKRSGQGSGGEFVAEIEQALLQACEMPQRFPKMLADVRCVRVRRFPYSISSEFGPIG